jgi:hypothetical protein
MRKHRQHLPKKMMGPTEVIGSTCYLITGAIQDYRQQLPED